MPEQNGAAARRPLVMLERAAVVLRAAQQGGGGAAELTDDERRRAASLRHRPQRRDFVAAHLLARHCVRRFARLPATTSVTLRQECERCGGSGHGRPSVAQFPGLSVSLSHSGGVVAAVVGASPVAVDVESAAGFTLGPVEERLMTRVLRPAEARAVRASSRPGRAFLRQWVRKEALVKAGLGRLERLDLIDLSALPPDSGGPVRPAVYGGWFLLDWTDEDTDAVVAAVSDRPPRLVPLH
ncbi:4'-phosphopantetheinyl transferase family protein [Streptomyces sp. OZ13]|uniref:4'-phosphopantetheinyl transferase family protein n=1 Tax=Streptomyces sp. OZ13 TaxID=3452210 RepID=UPI003F89674D